MPRSMTGYGSAEGDVGAMRVAVEIRSVNHRFFSPSIKLPSEFARWEGEVRETLRTRVSRGHVTLTARQEVRGVAASIDEAAFARSVELLRKLKERHGLGDIDVSSVLRVPGVVTSAEEAALPETPAELLALVAAAADALAETRAAEGGRLVAIVEERLALAQSTVERLRAREPERISAYRDKLRARLLELAAGVSVEEQRLAMEMAIVADRLDVGEELDRFGAHAAAFRDTIRTSGDEPIGKRLGFLLQEMLREANTTGSKASDAAMQQEVVALKEELERIREQVENLE